MANPVRNPTSGQFASVAPKGAADSTPPSSPQPGPTAANQADPLPFLSYSASSSPCQSSGDLTAVSTPPGNAGPVATMPTSPMQDFGRQMGKTVTQTPPDSDTASS